MAELDYCYEEMQTTPLKSGVSVHLLHPAANRQALQVAAAEGLQMRRVRSQASNGYVLELYYQGQLIISEKAWVAASACHLALVPASTLQPATILLLQTPQREGARGQISVYQSDGQHVLHYPLQQVCKQLRLDQTGMSVFFENGDAVRLRIRS